LILSLLINTQTRLATSLLVICAVLRLEASVSAAPFSPYFERGPGALGQRALAEGKWRKAVEDFQRAAKSGATTPHRLQARFLLAYARYRAADYAQAAREFGRLIGDYPLMVDYSRYFAGLAHFRLREYDKATPMFDAIRSESGLSGEARLALADTYRARGKADQAITIWRSFLKRSGASAQTNRASWNLAVALLATSRAADVATKREAIALLVDLAGKAPLGRARDALALALKAGQSIPKAERPPLRLSSTQKLQRARQLYNAMRNQESELAFADVLRDRSLSATMRCEASYFHAHSIFKQRQLGRAQPYFAEAESHCKKAKQPLLAIKAIYNGARGLMRKADYVRAADQFSRIEALYPQHSYADDARLQAAEALMAANKKEKARELLQTLPSKYPKGDMGHEAYWRLALDSYLAGELDLALKHLDAMLRTLGRATVYYAEGQALYWKGRILGRQKKPHEAARAYRQAIIEYPLSYYALLSFNRLRETHQTMFRQLKRRFLTPIGAVKERWEQGRHPRLQQPAVLRGVELVRLGLARYALQELAQAGLRMTGQSSKEDLWLLATILDAARIWRLSHQIPRRLETSYRVAYPHGQNLFRWRISYPMAFKGLVEQQAKSQRVERELIWAVMREESGFTATAESYANAIGLMQLLLPTARATDGRHSRKHKKKLDQKLLQDAETNIRMGSAYLNQLKRAFGGSFPLAIAGYNAGPGAVSRWLKRFGKWQLDELIEQIPYDQTRRYTKRVLSSLLVYSALYGTDHHVPEISQRVPKINRGAFKRKPRRQGSRRR
jgi:soluble lytic murein transglycosylase